MSRRLRMAAVALVATLALLALAGAGAKGWVEEMLLPVDPAARQPVLIEIPRGLSTREVADLLYQRGLVRDPLVFRYYARYRKLDSRLQGGEYELNPGMTPEQILQVLAGGKVVVRRFTVPEGLTVQQVADLLAQRQIVSRDRFLRLAAASQLVDPYIPNRKELPLAQPLEGYLFPSTYDYKPGITEEEVLALMFGGVERVWTPELRKRAQELKLSVHQVMTLASIIEKEARVASERIMISGVYHNRLRVGMKLDADPTVRYALGKPPKEDLLFKDLEVESPYNTYRVAGLPPGPIAAPGESSIRAALYPQKHDFWYFVAKEDGSGEHYFAETLQQHDQNTDRAALNQKK